MGVMNDEPGNGKPDSRFLVDDADDAGLEPEVVRWLHTYASARPADQDRTVAEILDEANRLLLRHRAYSAARRAECGTRLRVLTAQMPAILWTTDGELRITSVMGGGLTAVGLEPMESIAWPLTEVLGTDDPESPAIAAHARALQGGSSVYEYAWKGRHYLVHVEALRSPHGAIVGSIGAAMDLTERRRAEQALDRREEQLTEAQRLAQVGSWEWQVGGAAAIWSDEMYRILGPGSEEFRSYA